MLLHFSRLLHFTVVCYCTWRKILHFTEVCYCASCKLLCLTAHAITSEVHAVSLSRWPYYCRPLSMITKLILPHTYIYIYIYIYISSTAFRFLWLFNVCIIIRCFKWMLCIYKRYIFRVMCGLWLRIILTGAFATTVSSDSKLAGIHNTHITTYIHTYVASTFIASPHYLHCANNSVLQIPTSVCAQILLISVLKVNCNIMAHIRENKLIS